MVCVNWYSRSRFLLPFAGHKNSFFAICIVMGRDGVAFYTEAKCVTSRWFDEDEKKEKKISTWEGTITRK
jgi:malonate-semialdehyde dehydrogenase (acetylating)/methylmalonate-semialdehyde dehydrogenase